MKPYHTLIGLLYYTVRTFVVSMCVATAHSAFAQPSTEDVLNLAVTTMSPPIQYRLSLEGGGVEDRFLYQKRLEDGSIASRIEYSAAISDFVTLLYKDSAFTYFPREGVAIDLGYQINSVKQQAENLSTAIASAIADGIRSEARFIESILVDNADCYQIEIPYYPRGDKAGVVPGENRDTTQSTMPSVTRVVIEKQMSTVREITMISHDNTILSSRKFREVKTSADLPNEIFQVPNGVKIVVPASNEEYGKALSLALIKDQPDRLVPKLPPRASVPIQPPARVEVTRDDARRLIENNFAEAGKRTGAPAAIQQRHPGRAVITVCIIAVLIVSGLFILARRRRNF